MARKCAVCGVEHSTCGQDTASASAPVDRIIDRRDERSGQMSLSEYEVQIPQKRGAVTTTMLLSDEDLKLYPGAKKVEAKAATGSSGAERKSTTPANKARTSAPNKRGGGQAAKKAATPPAAPKKAPEAQSAPAAEGENAQEAGDAGAGSQSD